MSNVTIQDNVGEPTRIVVDGLEVADVIGYTVHRHLPNRIATVELHVRADELFLETDRAEP